MTSSTLSVQFRLLVQATHTQFLYDKLAESLDSPVAMLSANRS